MKNLSQSPAGMQCYQVGGSVRDALMGRATSDRDFLVTGVSASELIEQGYSAVGKAFTVFLHPTTGDEYALPRGRQGQASPLVGIVEDLAGRDLTINAMAMAEDGTLIDPFSGRRDIEARILRHVGPSFVDDPVRVMRVARFAAELDFEVAPETTELARSLARQLSGVPRERIWKELRRGLASASPRRFIEVLKDLQALRVVLPEIEALFGVPQPAEHHPEIDSGLHTLLALEAISVLTQDPDVRFAVLMHDIGKGITPSKDWPRHIGHEQAGVPLVKAACSRLGVPSAYRQLALAVCAQHLRAHRAMELRPGKALDLIEAIGGFRDTKQFDDFLLACQADAQGRLGSEGCAYPQADRLREDLQAARLVDLAEAPTKPDPAAWVRERRIRAIRAARKRSLGEQEVTV